MDISIPNNWIDIHFQHCWNSLFHYKKGKQKCTKIPAWTVQIMVMWYLNTMISICQRASPPTVKWLTLVYYCMGRASIVTTHLSFKKTNDQHIGIDWLQQFLPADMHVASIHLMDIVCVSTEFLCGVTPYFCMFVLHRWGLISKVPLESKRKLSRERILMIAYGKGHRVNAFKFVLFLPTEQAKLVTFCFSYKYISQFNLHLA